ncbi:MAG: acyl-CoA dehydrogenase family protein, partial [Sphingomonas sp.]
MDFDLTERQRFWRDRVREFMAQHVIPRQQDYYDQQKQGSRWKVLQVVEDEKARAKAAGIWNLFMPPTSGRVHVDDSFEFDGPGLTNLEYALCAEEMGRVGWGSEVFNCSAPDTGNMEVFHRYGTREQKERWLKPLMEGEIRSAFLMTEPAVASSDATNIETAIRREGDEYVINGRKWWSSGAGDPRCKIAIVMGKTDFEAQRHSQQSMVLMELDAPGVNILRHLPVFGYDDAPHGHMEIELKDVRIPASNMLLGEGRGFEIAQGRLGPGRIHHCMRSIGAAERALELMCKRLMSRVAFGKPISQHSIWHERIAESRCMIDQARLMTLKAAYMMDTVGNKVARAEIAMIKVIAPNMACQIIDWAMQAHGGAGISQVTPLANMYAHQRTLR